MRRIQTDDVIAVAVDGVGRPPVGLVIETDDDAVSVALYSWASGHFSAGELLIRRRDVRATLWAQLMTPADIKRGGYHLQPGETLYDMEPLGQFQSNWTVK